MSELIDFYSLLSSEFEVAVARSYDLYLTYAEKLLEIGSIVIYLLHTIIRNSVTSHCPREPVQSFPST